MVAPLKFSLDLSTSRQVQAALNGVIEGVKNRVLKAAIGKMARAGAKVAKARAPMGATRLLKNSIGTRYKSYQRGLVWVYVIGPRRNMGGTGPGVPGPNGTVSIRKYDPVKYGHLAERGRGALSANKAKVMAFFNLNGTSRTRRRWTTNAVFARGVREAKGQPFMTPAYHGLAGMKGKVIQDVLDGIYREAAKYAAKGKSIYA